MATAQATKLSRLKVFSTIVAGSPGGSAIINYVAKTLLGIVDWNLDPQAALNERLLRIAISMYGNLKRIAAITGMQHAEDFVSLPTAQERLEQLVYRVHEPVTWKLDVEAKREHMQAGSWQ